MTKTALITGGAGFIGSHLVEHLLAKGWKVRVLDDLSTGHQSNLAEVAGKIEFLQGSITDAKLVARAVSGVEMVFHLAAKVFVAESFEKPEEYERVNVHGTAMLLAAAKQAGVRRVVFSSTCAVYGDTTELPIAETASAKPLSPYAKNKLAAEELGHKVAASGGPAFTALRYFNVYGPRQDPRSAYSGVISRFADALKKGEQPVIYGDGNQTRDFIHVSDVARANLLAAQQTGPGFVIYNIGTGKETSINELHRLMAGAKSAARHQPARAGDIPRSVANIRLAKKILDWVPKSPAADAIADIHRDSTRNR